MNETVNFIKAGIILVVNSSNRDFIDMLIVNESTFLKCQHIKLIEQDDHKVSREIMNLLFDNGDLSSNVFKEIPLTMFGCVSGKLFNGYKIIGIIPMESYE